MRICWAQYTLWAVIAVLGVASMLSGCGSKGDLYMPAPEQSSGQEPAPQPNEEK
jgi:predicted small lipoprotein YifL